MIYLIEVKNKDIHPAAQDAAIPSRLEQDGGLKGVKDAFTTTIYKIEGSYTAPQITKIAHDLLTDSVLQDYYLRPVTKKGYKKVEVWIRDSSTDVTGESVRDAVYAMGLKKPESVRIANTFLVSGSFSDKALSEAVKKTFVNEVLNKFTVK